MLPRERCDYSAIVDRPPLKLPGGARLVFWTIVNLEVWDIRKPMARQVLAPPTGQTQLPDVPNWSWHEYGMRVGVWRFFDLFKRLNIRPTLALNARVCEDYPRVAEQARADRLGVHGPLPTSRARSTPSPTRKAMVERARSTSSSASAASGRSAGSDRD
jgi:allantoinase